MKTKEQIVEWLKERHLYGRVRNYNANESIRDGYDEGLSFGIDTISSAFTWSRTPEGHDYWEEESDEFRDWFREE